MSSSGNKDRGLAPAEVVRQALAILSPDERRRLALIGLMTLVMSTFEVAGIASVLPFLAVVANPSIVESNAVLSGLHAWFGFGSINAFLIALSSFVLAFNVISNVMQGWSIWYTTRVSSDLGAGLATRMLDGYLRRPYRFHLTRNTADLNSTIFNDITALTNDLFIAGVGFCVQSFVTVVIVTLVVLIDPMTAVLVGATSAGLYGLTFLVVRKRIARLAIARRDAQKTRFRLVGEALQGIKDLKIRGLELPFVSRFGGLSQLHARTNADILSIQQLPRYALDIIAFGSVVLILLIALLRKTDVADVIPAVGLYALAGYRLMPRIQQLFAMATRLKNGAYVLSRIGDDIRVADDVEALDAIPETVRAPNDSIRLRDVRFRYPTAQRDALDGVTIEIPARASVGIVGSTGSGKTTAIDMIAGLLEPREGAVEVDGRELRGAELIAWRRHVGYVPQTVYLSDASVLANIAFGVPPDQIDRAAAENAARLANLHDFIVREMPGGYEQEVGDRGVRLSGGQRQRIGIARALYHNPDVIIFDEATSAVDNLTERAIMEAIESLAGSRTILMIAHRLTTVRRCDRIYILDQGRVRTVGTYDELLASDDEFRRMVHGESLTESREATPPRESEPMPS